MAATEKFTLPAEPSEARQGTRTLLALGACACASTAPTSLTQPVQRMCELGAPRTVVFVTHTEAAGAGPPSQKALGMHLDSFSEQGHPCVSYLTWNVTQLPGQEVRNSSVRPLCGTRCRLVLHSRVFQALPDCFTYLAGKTVWQSLETSGAKDLQAQALDGISSLAHATSTSHVQEIKLQPFSVPCHAGVGRRTSASVMNRSSVSIHAPKVKSPVSRRSCAPVIHAWKAGCIMALDGIGRVAGMASRSSQTTQSPAIII